MLVKAQERWLRKGSCRADPNTSLYEGIQRRDSLADEDHFVGIFGLYTCNATCTKSKATCHSISLGYSNSHVVPYCLLLHLTSSTQRSSHATSP